MTKEEFYKLLKEYHPQPISCSLSQIEHYFCNEPECKELDKELTIFSLISLNLHLFIKSAQNLTELMELDTTDVVNFADIVKAYPFEDTFEEVVRKLEQWEDVYQAELSRRMYRVGGEE